MKPFFMSVYAFLGTHPILIVYLFLGFVSLFHGVIEPKFPKAVQFLRSIGLDLPGLWRLVRMVFPQLPPTAPLAMFLLLFLSGCGASVNYEGMRSAVDVINGVSTLETTIAPDVGRRCLEPMRLLSLEDPTIPGHTDKVKALAKVCDPIVTSYSATRRGILDAEAQVAKAATGGITLEFLFGIVRSLTADVSTLERLVTAP